MKFIRFLQYLGIILLMGCSVGLLFTIIFMLILPMPFIQAAFSLAFFASFGATGYFMVNNLKSKKTQVSTEDIENELA